MTRGVKRQRAAVQAGPKQAAEEIILGFNPLEEITASLGTSFRLTRCYLWTIIDYNWEVPHSTRLKTIFNKP